MSSAILGSCYAYVLPNTNLKHQVCTLSPLSGYCFLQQLVIILGEIPTLLYLSLAGISGRCYMRPSLWYCLFNGDVLLPSYLLCLFIELSERTIPSPVTRLVSKMLSVRTQEYRFYGFKFHTISIHFAVPIVNLVIRRFLKLAPVPPTSFS